MDLSGSELTRMLFFRNQEKKKLGQQFYRMDAVSRNWNENRG